MFLLLLSSVVQPYKKVVVKVLPFLQIAAT